MRWPRLPFTLALRAAVAKSRRRRCVKFGRRRLPTTIVVHPYGLRSSRTVIVSLPRFSVSFACSRTKALRNVSRKSSVESIFRLSTNKITSPTLQPARANALASSSAEISIALFCGEPLPLHLPRFKPLDEVEWLWLLFPSAPISPCTGCGETRRSDRRKSQSSCGSAPPHGRCPGK